MSMIALNSGSAPALPDRADHRTIARDVLARTTSIRRSRSEPPRMLDELVSEWMQRRTVTATTHSRRQSKAS
jgi:hypothetical protein